MKKAVFLFLSISIFMIFVISCSYDPFDPASKQFSDEGTITKSDNNKNKEISGALSDNSAYGKVYYLKDKYAGKWHFNVKSKNKVKISFVDIFIGKFGTQGETDSNGNLDKNVSLFNYSDNKIAIVILAQNIDLSNDINYGYKITGEYVGDN